eukprot:TRINITY_DN104130_c0_g1_i3.p1 TRINITY_DN104130_c0_g1~~TRINITY_DN104130_c0_g1_i3.p1  ORF type:complete len:141 (+),score=5.32 TRINITY_DN104130_c0_g1_i3:64-486(+)
MLALCCDFRIMTDESRRFLCVNEVELGLPLTPGMAAVVKSKVNRSLWTDLILRARRFAASELLAGNVIHEISSPGELEERAIAFINEIGEKTLSRESYGYLKRETWKAELHDLKHGDLGFAVSLSQRLESGNGELLTAKL